PASARSRRDSASQAPAASRSPPSKSDPYTSSVVRIEAWPSRFDCRVAQLWEKKPVIWVPCRASTDCRGVTTEVILCVPIGAVAKLEHHRPDLVIGGLPALPQRITCDTLWRCRKYQSGNSVTTAATWSTEQPKASGSLSPAPGSRLLSC